MHIPFFNLKSVSLKVNYKMLPVTCQVNKGTFRHWSCVFRDTSSKTVTDNILFCLIQTKHFNTRTVRFCTGYIPNQQLNCHLNRTVSTFRANRQVTMNILISQFLNISCGIDLQEYLNIKLEIQIELEYSQSKTSCKLSN